MVLRQFPPLLVLVHFMHASHFFLSVVEYLNVTECKSISYRPILKVSLQIPDRKVEILEFCGFCTFISS